MFAIVTLEYIAPLEDVLRTTDDHRAHLRALHAQGKLVAAGPFVPRTGGLLILHGRDIEEIHELIRDDPFNTRKIARFEVREWNPVIGVEALAKALERPVA